MKQQATVKKRSNPISMNTAETLRYFYHPDHIGSTSWVTDSAKNGIQYCEYLPAKKLRFFSSLAFGNEKQVFHHAHCLRRFGEPFLDQRSTTWNSRYTFSGKERDGETGYSYFGARYYNSDISIWLSVDPLSDKYPNQSNYVYCSNNPIMRIDPNGEDDYFNENGVYLGSDFSKTDFVRVMSQENWDNTKMIFNENSEDEFETINQDLGILFSNVVSESNISDEVALKIYGHYNTTDCKLQAMNKAEDNGESGGMRINATGNTPTHIEIKIEGNKRTKVSDHFNEIVNMFSHEEQHEKDIKSGNIGNENKTEERAINAQKEHSSFSKTRPEYQKGVKKYGIKYGLNF